jgi:hypothetical protein
MTTTTTMTPHDEALERCAEMEGWLTGQGFKLVHSNPAIGEDRWLDRSGRWTYERPECEMRGNTSRTSVTVTLYEGTTLVRFDLRGDVMHRVTFSNRTLPSVILATANCFRG